MRLRLVPVERNECSRCGWHFDGQRCTRCDAPFSAREGRRTVDDWLILVDVHPPIYRRVERCRCPACRDIYEITEEELKLHGTCSCDASFLDAKAQEKVMAATRGVNSSLQAARRLAKVLADVTSCPNGHPLPRTSWCRWCREHAPESTANGLPETPTMLWVRTGFVAVPVPELSLTRRGGRR